MLAQVSPKDYDIFMHPNAIALGIGDKRGRLTVLEEVPVRHNGLIMWKCKCDCGNEHEVSGARLANGSVQSCGCLAREWEQSRPNTKKLEGQRFGKLVVTAHAGRTKGRSAIWECRCDCGQAKIVEGGRLRNGDVTCCGCSAARTVMSTPNNGTKTCSSCKELKPLSEFEKSPRNWAGVTKQCKKCRAVTKGGNWLVWRYGITKDQFEKMKLSQDGRCAICLTPTKRLYVDHCHNTKRVRGLLCHGCNAGLGLFGENPTTMLRAIEYIKPPADSTAILLAQSQ